MSSQERIKASLDLFQSVIGQQGQEVLRSQADWRVYRARQINEVVNGLRQANAAQDEILTLDSKPCNRCMLPVVFRKGPTGKWECYNTTGTPHWTICGKL